jgi:hypothetical protein
MNSIMKAPDVPIGGENVKTFPDELKVVQEGISKSIMLTA